MRRWLPQRSSSKTWAPISLDQVELIMAFEEKFGLEIPDAEAEKLVTVGTAIEYLEEAG